MARNANSKLAPCMTLAAAGPQSGWNNEWMMRNSVSSPAHPSPRLLRVTPTWVTESSRAGFASRLSAACAPDWPSSAGCRRRELRTESNATSAAAKKPFSPMSSATRMRRNPRYDWIMDVAGARIWRRDRMAAVWVCWISQFRTNHFAGRRVCIDNSVTPGGRIHLYPQVCARIHPIVIVVGQAISVGIGVKISYAELRLVGEDCWPASGILMNCAGDRDSPRFVSIAKRPCLGRRRVAPTASYEIETRRYADT